MYDVVVIGAGAAGLTAAIYGERAGMNVVVFEKMGVGGQIILTQDVENYPGFPSISGPELMEKFEEHAKKFGVEIRYEEVKNIEKQGSHKGANYRVTTDVDSYETIAIVVATGSQPKKLHVDGEQQFIGRGVSYCAVCDGPFFKDKEVAVIGGGDAAVKEAIYIAQIVKKVTIIHRRNKLRAEKILQDQAFANPKIDYIWNSVVDRIDGTDKFEGITLKDVNEPEKLRKLDVEGVFVYIGHIPNTKFIDIVKKNKGGSILTDDCLLTSAQGVFAAGDCRDTCLRQIATCVGDGALAAYHAGDYVELVKTGHA